MHAARGCAAIGLFVCGMQGDGTRKGERAKKVPRYMQYDVAEYGISPARTADQKDKQASAELNQLARLLQKFLNALSQKLHHHAALPQPSQPSDSIKPAPTLPPAKRLREGDSRPKETEPRAKNDRRTAGQSAAQGGQNGRTVSLQVDQDYHLMLSDHIRGAYPGMAALSADMLRGLEIPRELVQGKRQPGKDQKQERQKPKQAKDDKEERRARGEAKTFTRQSFHIAIAYHIHLRRIGANGEIDPTLPARRLRESQQQQQQGQQQQGQQGPQGAGEQ